MAAVLICHPFNYQHNYGGLRVTEQDRPIAELILLHSSIGGLYAIPTCATQHLFAGNPFRRLDRRLEVHPGGYARGLPGAFLLSPEVRIRPALVCNRDWKRRDLLLVFPLHEDWTKALLVSALNEGVV